jgi:hypothetical protein
VAESLIVWGFVAEFVSKERAVVVKRPRWGLSEAVMVPLKTAMASAHVRQRTKLHNQYLYLMS